MVSGSEPRRQRRIAVDWQLQLITLYEFIGKPYRDHLWVYCQRFSPHTDMSFSDEEVICQIIKRVMSY